uniref:NADH:ubiquinone reductase (H(+)-translocating) n=1 Tax=Tracheophilus cymbius TaxID=2502951 RepID=A0A516IA87_9TREM|nr:NADH dehydrogenase subunit 5 [Tracheophilus cymbius]QDP13019.1 NADH dehydrogenase subunit 5 [Tracheophilus cymbius]
MLLLFVYLFSGLLVLSSCLDLGACVEMSLLSPGFGYFDFFGLLDDVSCVFLFMLFCCGSLALFYCFHYFSGSSEGVSLFVLVVWFFGVMDGLVFSSSLLLTLGFWNYLWFAGFFLILFYSNSSSLQVCLLTLFASRFGDVSLFVLVVYFCSFSDLSGFVCLVLFLLIVIGMSACFPFISWLLEAMRAPIPVWSLMHSSTNLAVDEWFWFHYWYLVESAFFYGYLVYFCFVTILIFSVSSLFLFDLKKMMALSTCNNISCCLIFFGFVDLFLSLIQLLCHGVWWCYLFISVCDLMSCSVGSQFGLRVYSSRYGGFLVLFVIVFFVLCLSRVLFLGVFFSKQCFYSSLFYLGDLSSYFSFSFCLFMMYVYSVCFCFLLVGGIGGGGLSSGGFFLLVCPFVVLGTFLNFFWSWFVLEDFVFDIMLLILFLIVLKLGCWTCTTSCHLFPEIFGRTSPMLWGGDGYVFRLYSFFVCWSRVFLLALVRWEFYVLSIISFFCSKVFLEYRSSLFSLYILILSFFVFLGVLFLLF